MTYIGHKLTALKNMIVVTVFLSNLNQMDFHLVQNRKENYHHDHIPFNLKGNRILVFSVWLIRTHSIAWLIKFEEIFAYSWTCAENTSGCHNECRTSRIYGRGRGNVCIIISLRIELWLLLLTELLCLPWVNSIRWTYRRILPTSIRVERGEWFLRRPPIWDSKIWRGFALFLHV